MMGDLRMALPEAFLEQPIPFEMHLTIESLPSNRLTDFLGFCAVTNAKPLIIELSRGTRPSQPMLSKVVHEHCLADALVKATDLSVSMKSFGFLVDRVKFEVPSRVSHFFDGAPASTRRYFEWHGKVRLHRIDGLHEACEMHGAHVSLNSLAGANETRFVTLREFGTRAHFEKRVFALQDDLNAMDWQVIKQQSEYCLHDDNRAHDKGWLTCEVKRT